MTHPEPPPGPDRMWAPWRMSYLHDERDDAVDEQRPSCVFCAIGERHDDATDLVLWRGRTCFTVMNLYPYNNGHLMVIPYRHVNSLLALDDEESQELMELARRAQQVLVDTLRPDGVNLGMNQGRAAGAGIADHLHLHVLPRWEADTNFMTSLVHTRVMPQALRDTYNLLLPGFTT